MSTQGYQVICGAENTGGYENNWVSGIKKLSRKDKNIEVYRLNPKAVKHQIHSLLRSTINDRVSAEGIAMYMNNNYNTFKQNWEMSMAQSEELSADKMLHGMIQSLIKQKTMKMNQLEKAIYQTFPEMLTYIKDKAPQWVYKLLEKYPSSEAVKRAKIKGLTAIRYINEQRAIELKEKARQSIAAFSGDVIELIVSQQCKDINAIKLEINILKKTLIDSYKSNPKTNEDLELLTSVAGIAEWSAVSFLIELGDYNRFESTSQLAAFFGVNPSHKQSGDGIYKVKMSKQGAARMRANLYIIAGNLVLYTEYFSSLYTKHKAKGKKHRVVMGILMHKALRVLWGMLKTRTKFDADVDRENQARNTSDTEIPLAAISIKARRHQELSTDAPISRSNAKKRKAILEPQASIADENTRSSEHSPMQI